METEGSFPTKTHSRTKICTLIKKKMFMFWRRGAILRVSQT